MGGLQFNFELHTQLWRGEGMRARESESERERETDPRRRRREERVFQMSV